MRALACVLVLSLGLAACASPTSRTYEAGDVGRTIETMRGRVVSSRIVDIAGESDLRGPVAGGVVGAGTTGLVVHGSDSGLAALLAGVIGAGVGYLAQQRINDREGIEYILDTEDGRTVTLVQNREEEEEPIEDGTPVLIQVSGQYTRVLPDPRAEDASGGAGGWVDPDTLPPAAGEGGEASIDSRLESGAGRADHDFEVGRAPDSGEPFLTEPAGPPRQQ